MNKPIAWMLENDQAVWFELNEPGEMPADVVVTPLVHQELSDKLYFAAILGLLVLEQYIDSPNVPVIMEDAPMAQSALENAIWEYEKGEGDE
jgi:hypothetical protein